MEWKKIKDNKINSQVKEKTLEQLNMYKPEINNTSKKLMLKNQAEVNKHLGRDENAPFNRYEQL